MKAFPIELNRKIVHLCSLVFPLAYRYIIGFENRHIAIFVVAFFAALMLLFEVLRFKNASFRKVFNFVFKLALREKEGHKPTGAIFVLTSFLVCIVLFPPLIAFYAMAFLSIGDSFAAIVGQKFGKHRFKNSNRTLEGSIACFFSILLFGLLTMPSPEYLAIILIGTFVATVAEVINLKIDDNIKMPLFSGIAMTVTSLFIFSS
jgi:dolichol kinase